MGQIFNIRNFNAYTGRYSRRPNRRTPKSQIVWDIDVAVGEKLPILALRNRERDDECPLVWRPGRNTRIAVEATVDSLKAWQAFRPSSAQKFLEAERVLVDANRKLVEIFEKKIQDKLAEIWGEEESAKV